MSGQKPPAATRLPRLLASVSLVSLLLLCLAWELWLAPLRPGGSWMALKALPLVIPLAGILGGRTYTYRWVSMFSLGYFTEGVARTWSERGLSQELAALEVLLSLTLYASCIAYVRAGRPPKDPA